MNLTAPAPALVLGATGLVGRELVRQLTVRGTSVVAHVRPDSSSLERWRATFEELGASMDTTAWDAAALGERLRVLAPAQVYIVIGTTRSRAKADAIDGDIYERIDLGLTQVALDAIAAAGLRPRVIYLSSVGADPSARSAYLRARGKAEAAVQAAGVPWVIARPSIILGERDESRRGETAAAVIGDGLLAFAGVFGGKRLRARYRSTTADVLASALIRIGEDPDHDRVIDGADLR